MTKRQDIKKDLAFYGKLLHEKGLAIGQGGNLSARDGRYLIIKESGADMSAARRGDYIRAAFKDAEKGSSLLSSETPLHLACYGARDGVGAVIHAHSPALVAAASKAGVLESNSYEFDCLLGKDVPVVPFIRPGSSELAAAVSRKVKNGAAAVLMARHGAVAVGADIKEAYTRILALERACLTFLYLTSKASKSL